MENTGRQKGSNDEIWNASKQPVIIFHQRNDFYQQKKKESMQPTGKTKYDAGCA